jgi:hypothetical protein
MRTRWEKSNPIKSLRLKMTNSMKPVERESLVWGLQLFRQVQLIDTGGGPAGSPSQAEAGDAAMLQQQQQHSGRLNARGTIERVDFEARLDEVILVDGNHVSPFFFFFFQFFDNVFHLFRQRVITTPPSCDFVAIDTIFIFSHLLSWLEYRSWKLSAT